MPLVKAENPVRHGACWDLDPEVQTFRAISSSDP